MNMKGKFENFVRKIKNTQEVEINCSTCLDLISEYVDLDLATGKAAEGMPQVKQHLGQCAVCHEEYELLRELAWLEVENHLPTNEELADRLRMAKK
jgi:hypothetical protein